MGWKLVSSLFILHKSEKSVGLLFHNISLPFFAIKHNRVKQKHTCPFPFSLNKRAWRL